MDQHGAVFLLLTGCVLASGVQAGDVIRRYHHVTLAMTWAEAQRYCRGNFSALATIPDAEHAAAARLATGTGKKVWIGLQAGPWTWSSGETVQSQRWYWNWAELQPQQQPCVYMDATGRWATSSCEDQRPSLCSTAPAPDQEALHQLVTERRSWAAAQSHCRAGSADLSRITDASSNQALMELLLGQTSPNSSTPGAGTNGSGSAPGADGAWFGLSRASWAWSDGSTATYRRWGEAHEEGECVMMETTPLEWLTRSCRNKHAVLCQSVGRVSAMLKVRLSSSADLSAAAVQESLLKQVKQRLTERGVPQEVTARWRKQPDGTIFHKEEEEEEEGQGCGPLS